MASKASTAFQGSGSGRSKFQSLKASGADAHGKGFPRGKGVSTQAPYRARAIVLMRTDVAHVYSLPLLLCSPCTDVMCAPLYPLFGTYNLNDTRVIVV